LKSRERKRVCEYNRRDELVQSTLYRTITMKLSIKLNKKKESFKWQATGRQDQQI
jgi:hypothetical protein